MKLSNLQYLGTFTRVSPSLTWVKVAEWMEVIGDSQEISTFSTPKVMDWDEILRASQVLREVTRSGAMEKMRTQEIKLTRLTKETVSKLVESELARQRN